MFCPTISAAPCSRPDRPGVEGRDRDRDRRRRGLHDRRHHEADDDQLQKADRSVDPSDARRAEHGGQIRRMQALREAAHALLERRQPVEDEREARERGARRRDPPARQKLRQRADEDHRQRIGRERDAHADQRDEPAGARRADVRAEHQAEPLREGQKSGADEADRRHRHRARRLHEQRDDRAPEGARQRRRRRLAEHRAQRRAGQRLEPVGHDGHAEQEQSDPAENRNRRRHARFVPSTFPPRARRAPRRGPSSARP